MAPIYLSDLLAPRCYKHSLRSCSQELNTRTSQCTLYFRSCFRARQRNIALKKLVKLFLSSWYLPVSYLLWQDAIMFSHFPWRDDYWNNDKTHRHLYLRGNGDGRAYPACAVVDIWGHEKKNSVCAISEMFGEKRICRKGHFRVPLGFYIETRLSA